MRSVSMLSVSKGPKIIVCRRPISSESIVRAGWQGGKFPSGCHMADAAPLFLVRGRLAKLSAEAEFGKQPTDEHSIIGLSAVSMERPASPLGPKLE